MGQGGAVLLDAKDDLLTEDEVRDTLEKLTSAEHFRLGLMARRLGVGTSFAR